MVWFVLKLSGSNCEDDNPVVHLTRMVEVFGGWVATLMGSVRLPPAPMGRARAVNIPQGL